MCNSISADGKHVCVSAMLFAEAWVKFKSGDFIALRMGEQKVGGTLGSELYFEEFEKSFRKLNFTEEEIQAVLQRERDLIANGKRTEEWDGTKSARMEKYKKEQNEIRSN